MADDDSRVIAGEKQRLAAAAEAEKIVAALQRHDPTDPKEVASIVRRMGRHHARLQQP